jgi:NHL repeat
VAVDARGDVFVADTGNNRAVELAAGSSTQVTLPFTGLSDPEGVAVDAGGDVYAADTADNRAVELPFTGAGFGAQVTLPFTGLIEPTSVGVDAAGDVFVSSSGLLTPPLEDAVPGQIFELPAGSSTQQVPSAAPVGQVDQPPVMAVNAEGDVFIGAYGSVDTDDQGFGVADTVVEVADRPGGRWPRRRSGRARLLPWPGNAPSG